MKTTQQRIGVRVPGGPKSPKPNWPGILAWLGIAALILINILMNGCAATKAPAQSDPGEPIGPYHILEGGISSQAANTYECDHFYVTQAIPVNEPNGVVDVDPVIHEIIQDLRAADGWPCVCIKCMALTTCY